MPHLKASRFVSLPQGNPMLLADRMRTKLTAALQPVRLELVDRSAEHAGHAGLKEHVAAGRAPASGETHFDLLVVSPAFRGQSRVTRQRLVYKAVAEELAAGVHALAITALTPEEA